MIEKTKEGQLIQITLNKGMVISPELERIVWQKIFNQSEEKRLNVLNLASSDKMKIPIDFLEDRRSEYKINAINLELDSNEFVFRCTQSLSKSRNLTEVNLQSFLIKYQNREIKRKESIKDIESSTSIKFRTIDAKVNEKKILTNHIRSR